MTTYIELLESTLVNKEEVLGLSKEMNDIFLKWTKFKLDIFQLKNIIRIVTRRGRHLSFAILQWSKVLLVF